ncbi:hypothetical protein HMPREF0043_01933 [Actinobaculum sp. oral taxon 183 str. F0552]|nr:hypothetical protein HMPREF0043_01933 [Actinobaculum sp. oral taxon 183 str. F0552]
MWFPSCSRIAPARREPTEGAGAVERKANARGDGRIGRGRGG